MLLKVFFACLLIIVFKKTLAYGSININENINGALLGELESGEILYEYNVDEVFAIASVSKIMTYIVMMDKVYAGEVSLDDQVVVSEYAASIRGSGFDLEAGEVVKLETLAEGLMIVSGNDSATAIAEHVAGSEGKFIEMMNERAKGLGLETASFINPHGLPKDDGSGENFVHNSMSVSDLYKLSRYVIKKYPEILEITKKPILDLPDRNFNKNATNPMLSVFEEADGLKTGYTKRAGSCLVSTMPIKRDGEEIRLIGIILGGETKLERDSKTEELLNYGKNNFVK